MDLTEKIQASIALIKKGEKLALALHPDGYHVGFSGGKDSQVLLELVKMAGVKFQAVYSVTTNDPPENVYFIRNNYPEVIFHHPKENFFKLVEKKGLPTMFRRYCCAILKEGDGVGKAVLTGVRAEESAKRSKYPEVKVYTTREADRTQTHTLDSIEANEHRCIRGKDKLMIYPILKWTEAEVWEFIKQRELPRNPCYEHGGRVGCMFCPFSSRKQILYYAERYPKFKEHLIVSLKKFMAREHNNEACYWEDAEEYFDWWTSKKGTKEYIAQRKQLKLDI